MAKKINKNILIGATGVLFGFGVFCHLFSLLIPEIFYVISFCLMIGLLADYAWSIRNSIVAIIPAWLAIYPLYLLMDNMPGLKWLAFYLEFVYFLFFPVFGAIFIYRGIKVLKTHTRIGIHFIIYGIVSSFLILYEFGKDWTMKKYMPQELLNNHRHFKWVWLFLFLQALIMDVTEKLEEKEMKAEQTLIRWTLPLISIKFFADYLFV